MKIILPYTAKNGEMFHIYFVFLTLTLRLVKSVYIGYWGNFKRASRMKGAERAWELQRRLFKVVNMKI